jgi:hypothetical protein
VTDLESCSVCGRTILAGERTRLYLTPEGEKRNVCELCRDRAEHLGWVREDLIDEQPPEAPRRRRRGLAALFRSREGGAPPAEEVLEEVPPADEPLDGEPAEEAEPEEVAAREGSPDPAGRGADVGRHSQPAAEQPHGSPLERALERFNASEQAHTVAGLTRTLGPPWVSIGAAAGSPSEIRITVAWELSWYQWGVDLRDEGRPVYQIDKGYEVDQLDAPARHWNAQAEAGGRLRLGAPEHGMNGDEAP